MRGEVHSEIPRVELPRATVPRIAHSQILEDLDESVVMRSEKIAIVKTAVPFPVLFGLIISHCPAHFFKAGAHLGQFGLGHCGVSLSSREGLEY
jgi:hypothetical protein